MPCVFARFKASSAGNTGILFALLAVPLLLAVGAAVDYVRLSDRQTELSAALDGAALAAATAKVGSDAERIGIAEKYFKKNVTVAAIPPELLVRMNGNAVLATATEEVPTLLMKLGGISTMQAKAQSEVMLPSAGKAEVALVLDYSGSMTESNKYVRMASAAKDMVTHLSAATEPGNLKVGLVPFSAMVRTSMPATMVSQTTGGTTWNGCTQDRPYPDNTVVSSGASKWGYFDKTYENQGAYDCNAYASKNLDILPLTDDFSRVTGKLGAMKPLGNTNIALGAEFGWNILDEAALYTQGAPYTDSQTRKYLVLLTDGVQTSSEWGPGKSRNVENGQKNLLTLCAGMRAKGITVFTIAYDVTDKKVTGLLKDCAPGKYFEPDVGGNSISMVFAEITAQISNELVRLIR